MILCAMLAGAAGCAAEPAPAPTTQSTEAAGNTASPGPLPRDLPYTLTFASEGDIYRIGADGTHRQPLTHTIAFESYPAWAPAGDYLAVSSAVDGNQDIVVMPISPEGIPLAQYNLTQSPTQQEMAPAWSPDGNRLAYSLYDQNGWRIRVIDIALYGPAHAPAIFETRTVSQITQTLRYKGHPAWALDGQSLAYTSDIYTCYRVIVAGLFGGDHASLPGTAVLPMAGSGYPASVAHPSWSPDGIQVAFAGTQNGSWDLYLVNNDGSDLRRLTDHPAADWAPAWSPDGAWLAFVSDRTGNGDLYLIRADGTGLAQLTDTPQPELSPAWQPPRIVESWSVITP